MKDFCGQELEHNDLVVSKSNGRYSTMQFAIIRDELSNVWFGPGSYGGSDIVKILHNHIEGMTEKRNQMIESREKDIVDRAKTISDKRTNRIKKKDFKRFGVYSDNYGSSEIFLGTCIIEGIEVENVCMKVNIPYKEITTKENTDITFWKPRSYYHNGFRPQTHRSVKYPQKFVEDFVLTQDEFNNKFDISLAKLEKHADWNHYKKIRPSIVPLP